MNQVRYSWSQPTCIHCFEVHHHSRTPVRLIGDYRETEICVYCGERTFDGIYIRIDPAEAPHPTRIKE